MDKSEIEKVVYDISYPIVESFGYELVGVEFVKEENEWYLRVYIDKEGGITIDDCANVSRVISNRLDEIDPIDCSYYLEVSSPGLDRPLKKAEDFERFKGKKVKIELTEPVKGKYLLEGKLIGLREDNILVSIKGNDVDIDRKIVSSIRLNDF